MEKVKAADISQSKALYRVSKAVRILTVAPVMALVMFSFLYFQKGNSLGIGDYIAAVLTICILPILAYPLQRFLPPFRDRGREGQRALAMLMSVAGYVLGVVYALAFTQSRVILTLFLTYLMSGAVLLVINKLFGFKASGHACGIAGPAAGLAYFVGSAFVWIGSLVLILALLASLYMKRHTVLQFIVGGAIPIASFMVIGSFLL